MTLISQTWRFSALLLIVYLVVFHLWARSGDAVRIGSTIAITIALIGLLLGASRQRYFVNRWDLIFHASVILDIALEGLLIAAHDDFSFYWCALGFTAVIAWYRTAVLRRWRVTPPAQSRPT